jgi:hypothetical protein
LSILLGDRGVLLPVHHRRLLTQAAALWGRIGYDWEIMSDELLPQQDTPERIARALLKIDETVDWDAPHPKKGRYLFRSLSEMAEVWRSHGGDNDRLPTIDLDGFMVLAVFHGRGGIHEISVPESVKVADGGIVITLGTSCRPWKMINPMSVIRLPRREGDAIFQD